MLDHTKRYVEKIHSVDTELARHAHKLDVKLQRLCGSGLFLFVVRMFAKPYSFGVNLPATLCESKGGIHFFIPSFEYHNRYKKLV